MVGGMTPRATVSASAAASSAPAAPRQWPIIDLSDVTGTDAARSPNRHRTARASARSFCGVAVPWALTWSTAVTSRRASASAPRITADRRAVRLRRGRVERLAAEAVAGQLAVDVGAARHRPLQVLEHEDAGTLADVHAGPAPIERPARLGIHQPQRVEAAERQPRERVGAAGDCRLHAPGTDGVDRLADRDRARRAGGDHAGPLALEPEALDAMTSTGVLEKWFHACDGLACSMPSRRRRELILLVPDQIAGPRSQEDTDSPRIDPRVRQAGVAHRLCSGDHAELVAARPAPAFERREHRAQEVACRSPPRPGFDTPRCRSPSPDGSRTRRGRGRSQVASRVTPRALTMPMPVIATRRLKAALRPSPGCADADRASRPPHRPPPEPSAPPWPCRARPSPPAGPGPAATRARTRGRTPDAPAL